jgi:hypothetical protein
MNDDAAARPATRGGVAVRLAGIDAHLESADEEFIQFAEAHLAPLRCADAVAPRVHATLRWHEGAPPDRLKTRPTLGAMDRVDRDLYRGEGELAWYRVDDLRDLQLRIAWDGTQLRLEGDYYHRLSKTPRRDQMNRLLLRRRLPQLRRRRFTTLLYYLLYYPCFWCVEREGWHPIHAGAVALPNGVAVFAGPSGIGKSTTVTGLATTPGARLLSDTFLLHRGPDLQSVPEPLLMDERSRAWLGADARMLRRVAHRYCLGREGYHLPPDRLSLGGRARVLLFPHRAREHYVRALPADYARGRLRAGDLIVNDLRRYWAFAAVLELLDPHPLVAEREASLAELVAGVPVYEIGLTPRLTRDQMVELVAGLMRV